MAKILKISKVSDIEDDSPVEKVKTRILGFDEIAFGGLPKDRTTLLSGTSGSGKTIFSLQFLVEGIKEGIPAVFVTFEEKPVHIIKNFKSLKWPLKQYVEEGKLIFLDASPIVKSKMTLEKEFDLGGLMGRINEAITSIKAKRVAIDSLSALFPRYKETDAIRRGVFDLCQGLNDRGVTTILTAERSDYTGQPFSFGIEEFVSDNVILLHNDIDPDRDDRVRSIEILKFRGATHDTQKTPLLVKEGGICIFPRPKAIAKFQKSSHEKISTGILGLDRLLFGGLYKNSVSLITGPSGCGKTVTALHFVKEGADRGEKCLYVALEESKEQLLRNCESFGWDMNALCDSGAVVIHAAFPEELKPEEHYKNIQELVEKHKISRLVIDSLSALERLYNTRKFREFTIGLNTFVKNKNITAVFTNTTASILDVGNITETHLSTATDNIILLKYVELDGQMRRACTVLKSRGSDHDKHLCELAIESHGVEVIGTFTGIEHLMSGSARRVILPPQSISVIMNKIEVLRKHFIDGRVTKEEYEKKIKELRTDLEEEKIKG